MSGALDWNLISPVQQRSILDRPGIAFRYVPLALIAGVAINTTHAPLDDVRVRRAIAASIDRQAISDKITFKRYPVVDTAQPLGSWARDPAVHLPAFDPAAADKLLEAAGWVRGADGIRVKNGKRLALTYVQFPESQTGVRAAAFIERELHARGIDLALKSVTNAQLFLPKSEHGALASGDFDLAYVPWPMGADPDDSFLLSCNGSGNVMRWCDPAVDALERAEALVCGDRAARGGGGADRVPVRPAVCLCVSHGFARLLTERVQPHLERRELEALT
jgi:peptide/nickel transport system substrate-binding protein